MVMSMDTSADQMMNSPPHFPGDDSAGSPSTITILGSSPAASPSSFQHQVSADDEHEDEHSKGSNQTVVAKQQQQVVQSCSANNETTTTSPLVNAVADDDDEQQEKMIVSRGSSFDGDRKLEMNIDDDSNEDSSMRTTSVKFNPSDLEITLAKTKKVGVDAKIESSLVAQMRDIVEGGGGGGGSHLPANTRHQVLDQASGEGDRQQQEHEQRPPKSSSDSLDNQNDNNTTASKVSLDSATAQKRTRHSRGHCRHHQHYHHQRHHRQSVSGASITGLVQVDSSGDAGATAQNVPNPPHYHHHHHRHSNTGHANPHHHHHQHHHHNHHPNHHHHHHHGHQHDKARSISSKRNSIQKLTLNEKSCDQQAAKNESNSSMSSISMTQKQQAGQLACVNPNQQQQQQSNPESKSSETQSEEHNLDHDNQELGACEPTANNEGQHQHHRHHHHCHHRTHKKRLVLDSGNEQTTVPKQSDGQEEKESSDVMKKPLQDSSSGMNVKCHHHHHHHPHDHSNSHHHHHHHHHNHPHHHHHHPHHHHHHHHQHAHFAPSAEDQQDGPTKDLDDLNQASEASQQQQQHSNRQHRHHHHHHHHQHGHHACRHHNRQRRNSRQRSGSKANISLRGSSKNLEELGQVAIDRRLSSQIMAAGEIAASGDTLNLDKENAAAAADGDKTMATNADVGDGDVVNMEMSPSNERKMSQVQVMSNEQLAKQVTDMDLSKEAVADNRVVIIETGTTNDDEAAAAKDSEISGDGGASRKHDSSRDNNEIRQANQENIHSRDVENNLEGGHSRLTRQMSSQSSKGSQKQDNLQGAGKGFNQQNHRLNECAEQNLQVTTTNQQASRPKQIVNSNVTADRRCRLCWCCCCPCSALSVKEAPERSVDRAKTSTGSPSSPTSKYPSPKNVSVSLDEIRAWGESFDKLMKCKDGRKVFQDFLRCEYSEENILFWSACEELKKERDSKNIAAKARDIYEDYISILSSKEVSLDSRVRDVINNNIKKPTSNIFDEAQLQIYTLMHRDSYPRFINSGMYKKMAQIATSGSRKSSS